MKLKIKFDRAEIHAGVMALEGQAVLVGIPETGEMAKNPKYPLQEKRIGSGAGGQGFTALRVGKKSKITLYGLATILDEKRRVISGALDNPDPKIVQQIADLFAKPDKTDADIRRIENAAQALLRNPFTKKQFGPNDPDTIKRKGFNHYGIQTGTLFKSITAKYFPVSKQQ